MLSYFQFPADIIPENFFFVVGS
ncbi:MAG: DUF1232 domain-containing protein [Candidatus Riflebacteria bacterium]|nr:DUF1232 domain-containing protein [Candidatus Riflebacteria bacterium]